MPDSDSETLVLSHGDAAIIFRGDNAFEIHIPSLDGNTTENPEISPHILVACAICSALEDDDFVMEVVQRFVQASLRDSSPPEVDPGLGSLVQ